MTAKQLLFRDEARDKINWGRETRRVMTDADNTQQGARAWYGPIEFAP